jgi:mono/diheme cytochrome c family protein
MVDRGYVPPPSFHQDYVREMKDGHFFDVITNGIRNMPAYAHQIEVPDRWAIVAYLRALQRSRNASENDVPPELRQEIREAGQ